MKVGSHRHIEVIGDRVLLIPDKGEERSEVGLYLPRPPAEKTTVMGGYRGGDWTGSTRTGAACG